MTDSHHYAGACLCGQVRFSADAPKKDLHLCHCSQCRNQNSGPFHAVEIPLDKLNILQGEESISRYRSSEYAYRAFCQNCGSSLFYHGDNLPEISGVVFLSAGLLEEPTGLQTAGHIFCGSKGDYYEIEGDLPQKEVF